MIERKFANTILVASFVQNIQKNERQQKSVDINWDTTMNYANCKNL